MPKVTKKELNLLKSLSEEEKEQFKKQVEDDEVMLDGLNRKIEDNVSKFNPDFQGVNKADL